MTGKPIDKAIAAAREFADRCKNDLGVEYASLFGSLVYREGERFAEDVSDVDLVVKLPAVVETAAARVEFASKILDYKVDLETKLATSYSRPTTLPICSLLLISDAELGADIHKDGAEGFFRFNEFHDLISDTRTHGMPGAGDRPTEDRLVRQCLRFAQKKRHSFLAVAANGKGSLDPYDADAPLPKDLLRHAAMIGALRTSNAEPGAEFDIQEGIAELTKVLLGSTERDPAYKDLRAWLLNKIATRRGILNARQQLLLAEIISRLSELSFTKLQRKTEETTEQPVESTPFFWDRVGEAFPGKRGIYWTTGPEDVQLRLTRLLANPLRIGNSTPIWMFRGGGSMPISRFEQLGPDIFMIDRYEVRVSRLALYQSQSYYRCFVYVECGPMAPSGVYDDEAGIAEQRIAQSRIYAEEYAITDDALLVSREEYDDGAAERDGKIINLSGRADLRVRYLTPYNFVLCAQMCPINNNRFDLRMKELLDRMLSGEDLLSTMAEEVEQLPRRDD